MWIYLACGDSISSLESEESPKPSKATSPLLPIVKTTDTVKRCFFHGWPRGNFPSHQSGTMCVHCVAQYFRITSISSMEDSPAKTLALPDLERAWEESEADYFSRSFGSSAKYDPDSSSWKTYQRLLFEEQNESLESFAAYGMTLDGAFYPLQMWERITDANDGGCWPTPTVNMVSGGANDQSPTVKAGRHGINLKGAVMNWPTPTATERSGTNPHTGRGEGLWKRVRMWPTPRANDAEKRGKFDLTNPRNGLPGAVMKFPTPTAQDAKNDGGPSQYDRNSLPLNVMVKKFPTPKATNGHGAGQYGQGGQDLQTVVGGKLNPLWVAWLMGYPSEWTCLEPWVIPWFRSKRGKRLKG